VWLKVNKRQAILIASMCYIIFFSVLNATMFNVALPTLSKEFSLTPSGVSWVVVVYSLIFAIGSVTYGKLADIYPIRRLIVIGLLLFSVGSLIGFLAEQYWMVIVARIIQGSGSAAIPALAMIASARYFPIEQRGYVMGFVASTVAFGFGIGPLLGGAIAQIFDWRVLFLVSVGSLFALPILIRALPHEEPQGGSFDTLGAVLFGLGVADLLLGINTNVWFLLLGFLFFVLFILHIRVKERPFIQISLFQNRKFVLMLLFALSIYFSHMATFFVLPLILADVNQLEPGWIGLVFFPGAMIAALLGTHAGKLSDRYGSQVVLRCSAIMMATGFLTVSSLINVSVVWISVTLIFIFLGFSSIQASLSSYVASTLDPSETGVGLGLYNLTAFMGGTLGPTLVSAFLEINTTRWNMLNPGGYASYSNGMLILSVICFCSLLLLKGVLIHEKYHSILLRTSR
jgi:DHA2 family metal-tetracycline-proton antiporter-like MFS transporter